jgi:arginine/ornithine transport system substrate-binding protein
MKRTIALLAITFLLFSSGAGLAAEKLRIANEGAYHPFNYIDPSGELKGFDVDIAKAICEVMGVEPEFVVQDWDGMIPGLLAKKYETIISSMSITEERKKAVNFTGPYYQVPARFVAPEGSGLVISKEGLKGKKIGVQRATTYANYLEAKFGDTVEIVYYDTMDNHNLDLKTGRIDAVLSQAYFMGEWLKKPDGKGFEFVGEPVTDVQYIGYGAGIAVRKEDTELLQRLNDALDKIIADGTHKSISRKYFSFDIYPYE